MNLLALVRLLVLSNFVALMMWLAMPRPSDAQGLATAPAQGVGGQPERAGGLLGDPRFADAATVVLPDGRVRMYFEDGACTRSAVSVDGTAFQEEPGVRFPGRMPAVVALPDGRWRMYYTPADGQGVNSAISTDGLTFQEETGVRLERGAAGTPDAYGMIHLTVAADPAGGFRMYYDGVASAYTDGAGPARWTIMGATSPDGLTWTRDAGFDLGIALDEPLDGREGSPGFGFVWSPEVTVEGSRFVMYFSAELSQERHSGIYRATSADGRTFRVERRPVLLASTPTDTPRHTVLGPAGVPQDPCVAAGRIYYYLAEEGIFSGKI